MTNSYFFFFSIVVVVFVNWTKIGHIPNSRLTTHTCSHHTYTFILFRSILFTDWIRWKRRQQQQTTTTTTISTTKRLRKKKFYSLFSFTLFHSIIHISFLCVSSLFLVHIFFWFFVFVKLLYAIFVIRFIPRVKLLLLPLLLLYIWPTTTTIFDLPDVCIFSCSIRCLAKNEFLFYIYNRIDVD